MENVVKIAAHVNDKLKEFQASGKPHWAADGMVKRADRYASSWHQNQRLLSRMEYFGNKAQDPFAKEDLGVNQ